MINRKKLLLKVTDVIWKLTPEETRLSRGGTHLPASASCVVLPRPPPSWRVLCIRGVYLPDPLPLLVQPELKVDLRYLSTCSSGGGGHDQ